MENGTTERISLPPEILQSSGSQDADLIRMRWRLWRKGNLQGMREFKQRGNLFYGRTKKWRIVENFEFYKDDCNDDGDDDEIIYFISIQIVAEFL